MEKELTFDQFVNLPAFPVIRRYDLPTRKTNGDRDSKYFIAVNPGLSKLEYFTGLAMQGFCADQASNTIADKCAGYSQSVAIATLKLVYQQYLVNMRS